MSESPISDVPLISQSGLSFNKHHKLYHHIALWSQTYARRRDLLDANVKGLWVDSGIPIT